MPEHSGSVIACFVLPVGDSIDSIFTTLKNAALIHQSGTVTDFKGGNNFLFGKEICCTNGVLMEEFEEVIQKWFL